MEDDDLIEIAGEDDSLLLQVPNDNSNRTYFTCSPLQVPKPNPASYPSITSPIESLMDTKNAESLNPSSVRASINKENISANKPEVVKLSMEPQPMKRKKKGGGYNLRKSLAWDRAFFTEEGVLDPLELSMISGNINQSGGERLSVIHEERRESLLGLDCSSESTDLQALEQNLFKELPVSIRNEDKNVAGGLRSKNGSSTRDNVAVASVAKRKVLSARDDNSSRSKRSGHQHPVVSPSLKRSSRVSTRNAPTKESKVSKIPAPKTNPSFLPNNARRATPASSKLKQNQTAKTVAGNGQKSTGLTSSSNNTKGARNDAKSNLAPKRSIPKSTLQQAGKKIISASEAHSPTISQHLLAPKANNGFKSNSGSVLPAPSHALKGCDAGSSNNAVSFPQNACSIGRSMQCSPASLQTVKPSGLRMPSPSLGLFSLSKFSTSDIPLQRSAQPFNFSQSSIFDSRKPSVLDSYNKKPPCIAKNLPESAMTSGFVKILGSSAGCPSQPTVCTTLHENMKFNSEKNILEVEATMPYPMHQTINNQQQSHCIPDDADKQLLDHTEPCKIQKFSFVVSQKNENESLPCGEQRGDDDNRRTHDVNRKQNSLRGVDDFSLTSHVKPATEMKSISGSNGLTTDQLIEGKEHHSSVENHDVSSELKFSDAHSYDACGSVKSEDALLGSKFLVNDKCQEQQGVLKPSIFEEHVVNVDSQRIEVKKGSSVKDNDFLEELEKVNRMDTQELVSGAGELGRSDGSSYSEVKPKAEDVGLQSSDAKPSLECDSNFKKASILDDRCLPVIDEAAEESEKKELLHSSLLADQVFQVSSGFHPNETQGFSAEGFQLDNVPQNVTFFASKGVNERDSKSSSALCLMPQALQDCGENLECFQIENHVLGSTCAALGVELEVNGQAASESEKISKDQTNAPGIAFEIDIPKFAAKANKHELRSFAALCLMSLPMKDSGQTMDVQYTDNHVSGSYNPLYEQDIGLPVEATPLSDGRDQITGIGATEIGTTNVYSNRREVSAEMECDHMDAHVLALACAQFERGMQVHGQPISSGSERISKDTITGAGDSTEIDSNNVVARATKDELESAVAFSLIPQTMHDFAEMAKSHNMEDHEWGSSYAQCGQELELHGRPTLELESASKYQRTDTGIPSEQDKRILFEATSSLSYGRDQISDIGMAPEVDKATVFLDSEELSAEMVECHHTEAEMKNISNIGPRTTEGELRSSSALCLMPLVVEDCNKECHHIKDDHVSVSTSAKYEQDIGFPIEATSSEPEGNDQITDTGMTSEIGITSVFLNSAEFGARYSEDLCSREEILPSAKHDVLTENRDGKDKQCHLLVTNPHSTFDIQTVEAIHYSDQHVLEIHNDCLSCKHDVHKESTEKTKLIESVFIKSEQTPQLKNQSPKKFYDCLFEGGSSEGVSLKVRGSPKRGMRSQFECTGQVNEDCSRFVLKGQFQTFSNSCAAVLNNISTDMAEKVSKGDHVELLANIIFHEESQKKDVIGTDCDVPEQSYVYQSESSSASCALLEPVTENGSANMVENVGHNPKVNFGPGFVEIEMSGENLKCQVGMRSAYDSQLSGQAASSELNSSLTDKAQISPPLSTIKSKTVCSLKEESALSIEPILTLSNENGQQHAKLDLMETSILLEEAEAGMPQKNGGPKSEMQHEFCPGILTSKERDAKVSTCKGTGDSKKLDTLMIKPPPHAVPFSDEWLAAFEAAGEEILALKSGAVQNSPPQQSLPEPGPWSPVRRKNNQEIGPFDCTKFTNTQHLT